MYTIGRSQAQSLTYLSLKECTFLTDKGFENLERFEWLEYLDMSHCRITDKTLDFILSTCLGYFFEQHSFRMTVSMSLNCCVPPTIDLENLGTLHLSATKVTSAGLAKVIAKSAWRSGLHTMDLSYCQGIAGASVLVNLQGNHQSSSTICMSYFYYEHRWLNSCPHIDFIELSNLRTLKLNNTQAFDSSPVRVPDSRAFARLLHVDLARTPINGQDLIALASTFKSLESLNLTDCVNVPTGALEHCAERKSYIFYFFLIAWFIALGYY